MGGVSPRCRGLFACLEGLELVGARRQTGWLVSASRAGHAGVDRGGGRVTLGPQGDQRDVDATCERKHQTDDGDRADDSHEASLVSLMRIVYAQPSRPGRWLIAALRLIAYHSIPTTKRTPSTKPTISFGSTEVGKNGTALITRGFSRTMISVMVW